MCEKDGETCCICLSEVKLRGGGDSVVSPGCCGAWFHQKCINDVLLLGRDTRCPLCRANFPPSLVASIERRTVCTRHFVSHILYRPPVTNSNSNPDFASLEVENDHNLGNPLDIHLATNNISNTAPATDSGLNLNNHEEFDLYPNPMLYPHSHDSQDVTQDVTQDRHPCPQMQPPSQAMDVSYLDSIERYYGSGERSDGIVGYVSEPVPESTSTPPPISEEISTPTTMPVPEQQIYQNNSNINVNYSRNPNVNVNVNANWRNDNNGGSGNRTSSNSNIGGNMSNNTVNTNRNRNRNNYNYNYLNNTNTYTNTNDFNPYSVNPISQYNNQYYRNPYPYPHPQLISQMRPQLRTINSNPILYPNQYPNQYYGSQY